MRGALEGRGVRPWVVFLEAREDVLIRRFSETRHRHPLDDQRGIANSIAEERAILEPVRAGADVVLDTSELSLRELRERLFAGLTTATRSDQLAIQLISFGFKYGLPAEADLVFDVRFLPNPNFVPALKPLTGSHAPVIRYMKRQRETARFLKKLDDFLTYVVPQYVREGKSYLTLGIGCTGGRHRSVMIANAIADRLSEKGYTVKVRHRDVNQA